MWRTARSGRRARSGNLMSPAFKARRLAMARSNSSSCTPIGSQLRSMSTELVAYTDRIFPSAGRSVLGRRGGRWSRRPHRGVIVTLRALCHAKNARMTSLKNLGGKYPIVVTIGAPQFAQIVARPDELVALTHDDPRTIVIKAELPLDGARNFHGRHCIPGRAMSHRQHRHQRFTVPTAFDCKCDDARAILATFFLSALRFVISEIRIRDHQARLGRRNCHAGVTSGQAACRDDRAGDPCVPIRPVPLLRRTTPP